MSRASALSEQVVKQLVQHPRALTVAGGVLGIIGLLPGMPNIIFLLLAGATVSAGYWLEKRAKAPAAALPAADVAAKAEAPPADRELGWEDVSAVDLVAKRLIKNFDRGLRRYFTSFRAADTISNCKDRSFAVVQVCVFVQRTTLIQPAIGKHSGLDLESFSVFAH